MKTASTALKTFLLNTANYVRVDFYTLTLVGGSVLRYCSASGTIQANGFNFGNGGPVIDDGGVKCKAGVDSSSIDITFYADDRHTVNGEQFLSFVEGGGLYGATLKIERGVAADWATMRAGGPIGTYVRFFGRFSQAKDLGQSAVTVTFADFMELLSNDYPPDVYQAPCLNTLGDDDCGVTLSNYAASGTVASGTTPTKTTFGSNLTQAAGYFELGYVVFTSGADKGAQVTVKSQDAGGAFTLVAPLPSLPAAGDTFTAYPGCPLTKAVCTSKFNNGNRFRGCPFIPTPTTGLVS